jgi:hypothetical protein
VRGNKKEGFAQSCAYDQWLSLKTVAKTKMAARFEKTAGLATPALLRRTLFRVPRQ